MLTISRQKREYFKMISVKMVQLCNQVQYSSIKSFKVTLLRCFKNYSSLFKNKSWHFVKIFQKEKTTRSCRITHDKKRKSTFLIHARTCTLQERSHTEHELFNTIGLSTITLLLLYEEPKKMLSVSKKEKLRTKGSN